MDRNSLPMQRRDLSTVALRKESVDRNNTYLKEKSIVVVALRKESVDRNILCAISCFIWMMSLSARRAWIEILQQQTDTATTTVALRKESVDRNHPK